MSEAKELFEKVIKNNYCIGCGACALVENSPFNVNYDEFGNLIANAFKKLDDSDAKVLEVCPFSGNSKNENEISKLLYSNLPHKNSKIGYYLNCYAGHVIDEKYRARGSSGGIAKWIGQVLLKENKIDYLIHITPNNTGDASKPLFDYEVITDENDVINGSKSAYYPVSMVKVITFIRNNEGRYAVTGIPCVIKTLRLLSFRFKEIDSRLLFTIGIICGGMKSANHAKILSWQLGLHPDQLVSIDFRRKHEDKPATNKIYQVWSGKDNINRYDDADNLLGAGWSGYFRPNACEFCDDVVSETADISIGDAWLPEYVKDPKGTSLIIVRNIVLNDILKKYAEKNILHLDLLSLEDVLRSQAGGFRHRREGLAYRIGEMEKLKKWYPPKRVGKDDFKFSKKRRKIYSLRQKIANASHIAGRDAIKYNDLNLFFKAMIPLEKKYKVANRGTLFMRALRKIYKITLGKIIHQRENSSI